MTSSRTAKAKVLKKRELQEGLCPCSLPRDRCWPVRFSCSGREAEKWASVQGDNWTALPISKRTPGFQGRPLEAKQDRPVITKLETAASP